MNIEKYNLSKKSFTFIKDVAADYGLKIDDQMEDKIYARLVRRVRQLQLPDFDAYCSYFITHPEERTKLINLITNSTTYFFRENYHFTYLHEKLFPELFARKTHIRIWSAGCATGEEPYSIAMTMAEVIPNLFKYNVKILATDINTDALQFAKNGIYSPNQISHVGLQRTQRWFHKVRNNDNLYYEIDNRLKQLVSFQQLNLLGTWPMKTRFDLIMCRNVIIYFTAKGSDEVLIKLNHYLEVGGILILGYAENLHSVSSCYHHITRNIYKKILD